jgi:hypothetical protein
MTRRRWASAAAPGCGAEREERSAERSARYGSRRWGGGTRETLMAPRRPRAAVAAAAQGARRRAAEVAIADSPGVLRGFLFRFSQMNPTMATSSFFFGERTGIIFCWVVGPSVVFRRPGLKDTNGPL